MRIIIKNTLLGGGKDEVNLDFLIEILKKKNIDHDKTIDYRVTRFLNKIF